MRGIAKKTRNMAIACLMAIACSLICLAPAAAFADDEPDPYAQAIAVELADGDYSVDLVMDGGSGRASMDSPTKLSVKDGHAVVFVRWSSPNYDYMLVDGAKYLNKTTDIDENSVFEIPVLAMNEPFAVTGDTTAMGTPHEIDYTITLDSKSIVEGAPASFDEVAASAAATNTSSDVAEDTSSAAEAEVAEAEAAATDDVPDQVGGIPMTWVIVGVIAAVLVIGIVIGVVRGRKSR